MLAARSPGKQAAYILPHSSINLSMTLGPLVNNMILEFLSASDLFTLDALNKQNHSPLLIGNRWKQLRVVDFHMEDWSDADLHPSKKEKINYWLGGAIEWCITATKTAKSAHEKFALANKISGYFKSVTHLPHFHYFMRQHVFFLRDKRFTDHNIQVNLLTKALQGYGGDLILQGLIENARQSEHFIHYCQAGVAAKATYCSLLAFTEIGIAERTKVENLAMQANGLGDPRALTLVNTLFVGIPNSEHDPEDSCTNEPPEAKRRKPEPLTVLTEGYSSSSLKEMQGDFSSLFPVSRTFKPNTDHIVYKILSFLSDTDLLNFESVSKNPLHPYPYSILSHRWAQLRKENYYTFDWVDAEQNPMRREKTNYLLGSILMTYLAERQATSKPNKFLLGTKIAKHCMKLKHYPHFHYFMAQQMFTHTSSTPFYNERLKGSLSEVSRLDRFGGDIFLQGLTHEEDNFDMFIEHMMRAINARATCTSLFILALSKQRHIEEGVVAELALASAEKRDYRALDAIAVNIPFEKFLPWSMNDITSKHPSIMYRMHQFTTNWVIKDHLLTEALKAYGERLSSNIPDLPDYVLENSSSTTDAPTHVLEDVANVKEKLGKLAEADQLRKLYRR